MAGLLAAEQASLSVERLEDVTIPDVRRHDADPPLRHEAVEAEVRHLRNRDELDAEVKGEHRDDRVSVDDLPALVDREHPVAVAVECHAEVAAFAADGLLQQPEVGRAAADVDVRPVGLVSDRDDGRRRAR